MEVTYIYIYIPIIPDEYGYDRNFYDSYAILIYTNNTSDYIGHFLFVMLITTIGKI